MSNKEVKKAKEKLDKQLLKTSKVGEEVNELLAEFFAIQFPNLLREKDFESCDKVIEAYCRYKDGYKVLKNKYKK